MKALDFMIIGAQKSGTTALADFLGQHSEVCMARGKEVHLFDDPLFDENWTSEEITERYMEHFPSAKDSRVLGEATPIYLFIPEIARRLATYNPNLKVIVILRDPVQRAYSQYRMERARGKEKLPFWAALLMENARLGGDRDPLCENASRRLHSYRSRGLYARQLSNLSRYFSRNATLVLKNEDLRNAHQETMSRVFGFLGLPPESIDSKIVYSHEGDLSDVPISARLLRRSYRHELTQLKSMVDFSIESWISVR